ncbi:MAG: 4,5-DOPA dioxygenase extradiol [Mycobacterium sp.]|uniref:4,5-DOPA-extradiol-dioxygenase n=1 Tax=Mycobacterium sp. TaxID=1785 RepID=UPI002637C080|nr:4,5-DOPA dioxygenase extradiol [Mycobacterium sp.]MDI3313797.1 4,5-DOPA dioxygenase extradiol [Mycobacterium sp.]
MRPAVMPAVFVGHGNPMNAIEDNPFSAAWRRLAASIPRPRAVLAISAHWYGVGGRVTAAEKPVTLHDFGGFPRALYEVEYPAPGSAQLAGRVTDLLAPAAIEPDADWGLDHGSWSVLVQMYPAADIPVVQLSIDETLTPAQHFDLGQRLRPLREEGILILGSGNVVHNLRLYAWDRHPVVPFDWAVRFDAWLRDALRERRFRDVIGYRSAGADAALAVPTPEHYLPLLYVLGACSEDEPVGLPVTGFEGGSVSMLAVRVG